MDIIAIYILKVDKYSGGYEYVTVTLTILHDVLKYMLQETNRI